MLIYDLFNETYNALVNNKARSALTILGIVIGIGSVIAMISIGQGAQKSVQESIQSIGANLLIVRPGSLRVGPINKGQGSANALTFDDVDAILEEVELINAVAPEMSGGNNQVVAKGGNTNASVVGVTPEYASVRNAQIDEGTFIVKRHIDSRSKVAVLGSEIAAELFPQGEPVGQKIRIKSIEFTIIGVLVSKGGTGFGSSDDIVYVPISTAKQFLTGSDYLSVINIEVSDSKSMDDVQQQIENILLSRHRISDPEDADFSIMNQADIVETASSVAETFTLFLGAVAGISLVVGGIGIMNMMLTSVTERTREIGLRKALGARRKDISAQFLLEAITLTLLGGILGIILGWAVSFLVKKYGGITTEMSLSSVILAFGIASIIGVVFGYYPARRAAKLNPIQALRYE